MEINGVTIQMLPAASGDCIYLEFPDPDFRILIDGGYAKTYHKYLKKFLLKLAAEGKRLNLIVVTHIDDDHISGIRALLKENGDSRNPKIIEIDEIWFNSLNQCITSRNTEQGMSFAVKIILKSMCSTDIDFECEYKKQNISYTNGKNLAELIQAGGYRWNASVVNNLVSKGQIVQFGDLKITILNPGIETLTKMGKKWLYHLKQINSNNIEITRDPLFDAAFEGFLLNNEKNIEFKQENISYSSEDLDWLDKYAEYKDIEMDSKITNCSSIAILIDYKDIKMLFPGDSPIQLFENELPKILDVIKLPHHGSAKNISLEFIKNTKVKYYLLSTDGKRYIDHPGKAVIANIIKNTGNNTELIKNYEIKFLGELLWSKLNEDTQLPDLEQYYFFVFMKWPHPEEIDPLERIKKSFISEKVSSKWKEDIRGRNFTEISYWEQLAVWNRYYVDEWSAKEKEWFLELFIGCCSDMVKYWKESKFDFQFTFSKWHMKMMIRAIASFGRNGWKGVNPVQSKKLCTLLKEFYDEGIYSWEVEAMFLADEKVPAFMNEMLELMYETESDMVFSATMAVEKCLETIMDQQLKENTLLELFNLIKARKEPGLEYFLMIIHNIFYRTNSRFPSKIMKGVSQVLRLVEKYTRINFQISTQEEFKENIKVRKQCATLAFLVYRFENTFYEGQHCPEVEEWKNICTGEKAENEFAEVKNCWLLPEL